MSQRTIEEYLETIGELEERENPVGTSAIAQNMGISLASVSEMLRRLSEKGLVVHTPYGGAILTDEGRKRFLRLTRRHRLWEVLLHRHLGIEWENVYAPACSLEHATSELVEEKLADFLDNPKVCPHGSPIPGKDLKRTERSSVSLNDIEAGNSATVSGVLVEYNHDFLVYLTELGIIPGAGIKVIEKAPFDGTLTVEVRGVTKAISRDSAAMIMVQPAPSAQD